MSYQKDRDSFLVRMGRDGMSHNVARLVLRHASTLDRLAVAQCNGDWPADNGDRKVKFCPECESGFVPSSFRKGVCPDCRASTLIREAAAVDGFKVELQGDPRGYVARIILGNGQEVGVPTRNN